MAALCLGGVFAILVPHAQHQRQLVLVTHVRRRRHVLRGDALINAQRLERELADTSELVLALPCDNFDACPLDVELEVALLRLHAQLACDRRQKVVSAISAANPDWSKRATPTGGR